MKKKKNKLITIQEFQQYSDLYEVGIISAEELEEKKKLVATPEQLRKIAQRNFYIYWVSILGIIIIFVFANFFIKNIKENRRDWNGFDNAVNNILQKSDSLVEITYAQSNPLLIDIYVDSTRWNNTSKLDKAQYCKSLNRNLALISYKYNILDSESYEYPSVSYYAGNIKVAAQKFLSYEVDIFY